MSGAEKLSTDLLNAMSGGVDQMTDGGDSMPAPKESGVVISERLDTIFILQDLCKFIYFFHCQVDQLLSECFEICHFYEVLIVRDFWLKLID